MTRYVWFYTVEGRIGFPIDMLRYDDARPLHEEDANAIELMVRQRSLPEQPAKINIRGYKTPTIGRWKTFGWDVQLDSVQVNVL